MIRAGLLRLALAVAFSSLVGASGCRSLPYCLDCEDLANGGGPIDTDAAPVLPDLSPICVPTAERCNDKDDDCNGLIDDGTLPGVGGDCGTDTGECTKGTLVCDAGQIVCAGAIVLGQPESCNGLDDDCDGIIDNGNPGGGVPCGNGTGDCVQGTTVCESGAINCTGGVGPTAELCDGHDNNCDGTIDEGNPGGGASCGAAPGVCVLGKVTCTGGQLQCIGAGPAIAETCNGVDDNCNGLIDEGFNVATDANNCGGCGMVCTLPFATARCAASACEVKTCAPDHWNLDNDPTNGCEYACVKRGVELCNGIDDDCDGVIDNPAALIKPDFCAKLGACVGTLPTCDGLAGWGCHYGPTVSTNLSGQIVPENDCDNKDNDCNAVVDDAFPTRGKPCSRGLGACTTNGSQVCAVTHDSLVCNAATPPTGGAETCNGIDDDCDGLVDNGAPDVWTAITVAGAPKQIYRYEASHPDATAASSGALSHRSCSASGRLPWVNVTYPEAVAACAAAGARICTEAEWQTACRASTPCAWSTATSCATYQSGVCNDGNFDHDLALPNVQNAVSATGSLASCYSDWGGGERVFDMSGNVSEWAMARASGINPLRGGAFNTPSGGTTCTASFPVADDSFFFVNVGFRCCRD